MFNPGLYFKTLDLTKTKAWLNFGLEIFVMWAFILNIGSTVGKNIIATTKIGNNYCYHPIIQISNIAIAILNFSLLPLVKLLLLIV